MHYMTISANRKTLLAFCASQEYIYVCTSIASLRSFVYLESYTVKSFRKSFETANRHTSLKGSNLSLWSASKYHKHRTSTNTIGWTYHWTEYPISVFLRGPMNEAYLLIMWSESEVPVMKAVLRLLIFWSSYLKSASAILSLCPSRIQAIHQLTQYS